jgi:hypothetical protein
MQYLVFNFEAIILSSVSLNVGCLNLVSKPTKLCISASHFKIHNEARSLDSK